MKDGRNIQNFPNCKRCEEPTELRINSSSGCEKGPLPFSGPDRLEQGLAS